MFIGLSASSFVFDSVYAVSFTDSTGYIPEWAVDIGEQQALMTCINVEYGTPDSDWCLEFQGYVMDKINQESFELDDLTNSDYVPQFNSKLFDETPKELPYYAYINQFYDFAIVPPISWYTSENTELIGGDAAPVAFNSNNFNPTYTANFLVLYQNFGPSYFDLLRFSSDETVLEDFIVGLTSSAPNTKVTKKSIESYVNGYKINVQFVQTAKVDDKNFVTLQREAISYILDTGDVYHLNFASTTDDFDSEIADFRRSAKTFHVGSVDLIKTAKAESSSQTTNQVSAQQEGGGCLIATATFGSELAPQVQLLREIRDGTVVTTASGTSFMTAFNAFYYALSPTIADLERQNPIFKEAVKVAITPLLSSLSLLQYVDIDSEAEMLGYGIGIILLNIGMYFVAPALIISRFKSMVS